MKDLGLADLGAYEKRLRDSEPELQSLVEALVVAESWFFRDERPFQWFREHVRARALEVPGGPPLRLLSLGCAAGEEPYSIAMTLLDLGLPARRFRIDAVDVSARQVERARRGVYSSNAFRGRELGYRDRYFRALPSGYELAPEVRATVHFHQASIFDPHLFEGSSPYDVVFCRNLLIYLTASARVRLMAVIDRLLAADGLLLIGHADRLDAASAAVAFTEAGEPGCFAYRRAGPDRHAVPEISVEPRRHATTVNASEIASTSATVMRTPLEESGNPLRPEDVDQAAVLRAGGDSSATLLEEAARLANQGRFSAAIKSCEQHLQKSGLNAAAYYLLGMICQAAGDRRRAEDCFHKVVYLDPRHDEALLSLALLAERRGDLAAATGFRRRAERTMSTLRK
jgi:chemotaxis protein methyltransferase WspC